MVGKIRTERVRKVRPEGLKREGGKNVVLPPIRTRTM